MKQLFFLLFVVGLLTACQQASSPTEDHSDTPKDSSATANSDTNTTPIEEPASKEIEIGPAVQKIQVLASKKAEDEPGEQTIKIDIGKGYTLEEKAIWFSGNEWSSRALEIKKDGQQLYTWENEDRNIVIRNRKFETDYPRLITKGDKALILFDIVIPPNGMAIDAVGIENGKFVGIMKDIKEVYLDEPETVGKLFSE